MRNRIKKGMGRLPYKYVIVLCVLTLICIMIVAFALYIYYDYRKECREIAGREAEYAAEQIVTQVDEKLDILKQYYLSLSENEDIKWVLENEISYADYEEYQAAEKLLSSTWLFGDYISGYALVNFRTGWIISSKGMFRLKEAGNRELLEELFERNNDNLDRNYWMYEGVEDENRQAAKMIDRLSVNTDGLSFVLKFPANYRHSYGMLLVNVNMQTWRQWVERCLDASEEVVVLSPQGETIFATDERLVQVCQGIKQEEYAAWEEIKVEGASTYLITSRTSDVLGWQYYVCYDLEKGQFAGRQYSVALLFSMFLLVAACFVTVCYMIYHPVDRLMQNVWDKKQQIKGNELDYLAGQFADLKNNKLALENVISQNQNKLQELFELRLIRGEVRADDEWSEYFEGLHLKACNYFAAAVMVLNLQEEQDAQSNVNEDAICLKLVEELPKQLKEMTWMPPVYNACTIFCLFGENDEDVMLRQINLFYDEIQEFAQSRFGYRILMGVSATHTEHRHIRAAYRESVTALTMVGSGSGDGTAVPRDCYFFLANSTMRGNRYKGNHERDIEAGIKAMDKDQCYKAVDEFCQYLQEVSSHEEAMVYILRMITAIFLTAVDVKLDLLKVFPDGVKKVYREIVEVIEFSRVRRYLKFMLIDPIFQARSELLEVHSYSIIEEIEKKIEETRGNITLTECADALGVHHTYIWKVLKMEKDKSFSDYLEEYKLEEAKRLLLQTNMSVAEIAAELNYTNAQNFIRFFSKSTGVTPGKFRKLY